jgi:hypothetical protein
LRDVSETNKDDLEDKVEELQGSTFDRTLEAAVRLGLFEKAENGYKPTTKGKKIGYQRLSEEGEQELFRTTVKEYEFYNELLQIVGGELTSKNGEQYLERDVVQSEIGINFDFGMSDRTLESAAGTFLQVLDKCGVGEYKRGHSDYPTRLVVNEEYSEFLSDSQPEETEEGEPTKEDDPSEIDRGNGESGQDDTESSAELTTISPSSNLQDESVELSETIEKETKAGFDVTVHIEVSSTDWESEEVISLIDSLKEVDSK